MNPIILSFAIGTIYIAWCLYKPINSQYNVPTESLGEREQRLKERQWGHDLKYEMDVQRAANEKFVQWMQWRKFEMIVEKENRVRSDSELLFHPERPAFKVYNPLSFASFYEISHEPTAKYRNANFNELVNIELKKMQNNYETSKIPTA